MTQFERKIINTYHHETIEDHYNVRLLIEFENKYLLFNSHSFIFMNKIDFLIENKWEKLNYDCSISEIFIKRIMEDELNSYFIQFSNDDLLYVFLSYNRETWWQEFDIVKSTVIKTVADTI